MAEGMGKCPFCDQGNISSVRVATTGEVRRVTHGDGRVCEKKEEAIPVPTFDRCPFEEHDCLRARTLLNQAVKLLDNVVRPVEPHTEGGAAAKAMQFLDREEIAVLVQFHRTGKVPMPADGQFVPRTEQVIEKMRDYVGGNVVSWFLKNLYAAASSSLRRGVALALMISASAAKSSKGQIRFEEYMALAEWAFKNALAEELAAREFDPPKPGTLS